MGKRRGGRPPHPTMTRTCYRHTNDRRRPDVDGHIGFKTLNRPGYTDRIMSGSSSKKFWTSCNDSPVVRRIFTPLNSTNCSIIFGRNPLDSVTGTAEVCLAPIWRSAALIGTPSQEHLPRCSRPEGQGQPPLECLLGMSTPRAPAEGTPQFPGPPTPALNC